MQNQKQCRLLTTNKHCSNAITACWPGIVDELSAVECRSPTVRGERDGMMFDVYVT